MNLLKNLFHKHEYKTVAYNSDSGYYTKKCKICGYKQRVWIQNETKYYSQAQLAEWAGDSDYFLRVKI